jgi:hypothetical protein
LLRVIVLSVIMLSANLLGLIMLSVIMVNVMAPSSCQRRPDTIRQTNGTEPIVLPTSPQCPNTIENLLGHFFKYFSARFSYRRSEIVPDLVGQRQLRDFRRHSGVVVDERDDAGVQRPLGRVVDAVDVLGVTLVGLANAAGGA